MKWNMGWMHDTLDYLHLEPVHRKFHHDRLTFSIWYAFSENFVLPLSHDEVVYGKGSLIGKMPGDRWQQFANLRALYGYMWGHPGKKLLFMGGEFGQRREWAHEGQLDWHLLQQPEHAGVQRWVADLNRAATRAQPALHELDFAQRGLRDGSTRRRRQSVLAFLRARHAAARRCSSSATSRRCRGTITRRRARGRLLATRCSTATRRIYGGSGMGNLGGVEAAPVAAHGHFHSLTLTLPPLATLFFKPRGGVDAMASRTAELRAAPTLPARRPRCAR